MQGKMQYFRKWILWKNTEVFGNVWSNDIMKLNLESDGVI